jgi:hypothetical protein
VSLSKRSSEVKELTVVIAVTLRIEKTLSGLLMEIKQKATFRIFLDGFKKVQYKKYNIKSTI